MHLVIAIWYKAPYTPKMCLLSTSWGYFLNIYYSPYGRGCDVPFFAFLAGTAIFVLFLLPLSDSFSWTGKFIRTTVINKMLQNSCIFPATGSNGTLTRNRRKLFLSTYSLNSNESSLDIPSPPVRRRSNTLQGGFSDDFILAFESVLNIWIFKCFTSIKQQYNPVNAD